MIFVLYILLTLIGIILLLFLTMIFAPVTVDLRVTDTRYHAKIKYIGYWMEFSPNRKRTGFLFHKFSNKDKTPSKEEKTNETKAEDKHTKNKASRNVGLSFWYSHKAILIKVVKSVFRFTFKVIASFRVKILSTRIGFGNDDPALTGMIFGWVSALKSSFAFFDSLDITYDFYPQAKCDFSLHIRARNNIFNMIFVPFGCLVWRLPKIELFKMYREYKKLKKSREAQPLEV